MAAKLNIFADEWIDMIFKTKNHEYGAYVLRKESSNRHSIALLIGSLIFVIGISSPLWINSIIPERKIKDDTVVSLKDFKMDKPVEAAKPIIDVPPPPPVLRNTIKFTPPVIKPDDQVNDEEEIKTQKDVVKTDVAIGSVNVENGSNDVELPPATVENKVTEEDQAPFIIVEQMPEFPGGMSEVNTFIRNNMRYPVLAQENGISGKVYIQFVIDKNGNVTKIKVVRGIGGGCDEEAVRVISKMPQWKPGKQGGKEVPVSYTIPVNFVLQQ